MIRQPKTQPKLPKTRRQYQSIYGLDAGLDYSKATTAIGDKFTPNCDEVLLRFDTVAKAKGATWFAGTDTVPLDGTVMHIDQFYKTTGADKLMVHTTKQAYAYNSTTDILECVTRGVVVEDCEDVWSVNANVTADVTTDMRKGDKSLELTIAAGFTTGVAAYENFASLDISATKQIHFYIRSSIVVASGNLKIRISEQNAGGTGATYEDLTIPALVAGVWTEVSLDIGTPGNFNALLSVSLVVVVDNGACVVDLDDVLAVVERTGDEDNVIISEIMNNQYIESNGIQPLAYWDMSGTNPMKVMIGGELLGAKKMGKYGERFILFHVIDNGTVYPQRVKWTIVGGLSAPPEAEDWTDPGSGDVDLESVMGVNFINGAEKLGNHYVIYGERSVVLMDYTGKVSKPYSFYTQVSGIGLPAERGIVNLGNEHIFLGWDDIYAYKGGKDVIRLGGRIRKELFKIVAPAYINRCFMVFVEETDEIRLFYPTTADTLPTKYFSYNLESRSWARGSRSYTGFGYYSKTNAPTWNTIGDNENTTWNEMPQDMRWDDVTLEALAPINLFGTSGGGLHQDDETTNNIVGVAIDGFWETKDWIASERYRSTITNWKQLDFEARGDTMDISYSVDQGVTWSTPVTRTLTSVWTNYKYDFNANSPMIRFKFRNAVLGETWEMREIQIGYIPGSDRGIG